MSDRQHVQIIDPYAVIGSGEAGPYPFDLYQRKCLAQGDSWFSIGALPPTRTTRILAELTLPRSTVIVNCAYPGAVLHRMASTTTSPMFRRFLAGKLAYKWDAILLSGGGNDIIDAVGSPPTAPLASRLLRTAAERGADPQAADYLSEPGWATFATHIGAVFNLLMDLRDSGINRSTPLIWHNYARVMPRPAPAGPGFGPWLLPALEQFAVPASDRLAVADALTSRLCQLIADLVAARCARDPHCALYVADSWNAGIALAEPGSTDISGDWINEIHLTREGYRKCAAAWQQVLDPILG